MGVEWGGPIPDRGVTAPRVGRAQAIEAKYHLMEGLGLQKGPDSRLGMLFLQQRITEKTISLSKQIPLHKKPIIRIFVARQDQADHDQLARLNMAIARVKGLYPLDSHRPVVIEEAMDELVTTCLDWTDSASLEVVDSDVFTAWKDRWRRQLARE